MVQILVVDNNEQEREQTRGALAAMPGTNVVGVGSGKEALALLEGAKHPFDVIVSEYVTEGGGGVDLFLSPQVKRPPFLFLFYTHARVPDLPELRGVLLDVIEKPHLELLRYAILTGICLGPGRGTTQPS